MRWLGAKTRLKERRIAAKKSRPKARARATLHLVPGAYVIRPAMARAPQRPLLAVTGGYFLINLIFFFIKKITINRYGLFLLALDEAEYIVRDAIGLVCVHSEGFVPFPFWCIGGHWQHTMQAYACVWQGAWGETERGVPIFLCMGRSRAQNASDICKFAYAAYHLPAGLGRQSTR